MVQVVFSLDTKKSLDLVQDRCVQDLHFWINPKNFSSENQHENKEKQEKSII